MLRGSQGSRVEVRQHQNFATTDNDGTIDSSDRSNLEKLQRGQASDRLKISIGRQQHAAVLDAELRDQHVDSPYLNAAATTRIPKRSGFNVRFAVGRQDRQRCEP